MTSIGVCCVSLDGRLVKFHFEFAGQVPLSVMGSVNEKDLFLVDLLHEKISPALLPFPP